MESKEQKAKEVLKAYNQEHIIRWMDKQTDSIKQKIVEQVLHIDIEELEELYKKVQRGIIKKNYNITPLPVTIKENIQEEEKNEYIKIGEQILKNGKYSVLTMAGGQGTRLRA